MTYQGLKHNPLNFVKKYKQAYKTAHRKNKENDTHAVLQYI